MAVNGGGSSYSVGQPGNVNEVKKGGLGEEERDREADPYCHPH